VCLWYSAAACWIDPCWSSSSSSMIGVSIW
jgi:hypothetical protein